ncbi:MAG: ATP-binding cassette domain-containing protein [Candidatus Moranbacteria bacterium]|nr:ATP-binding cassette domain-containing protein [Candidatus Moranbacteria bacterium]
MQEKTKNKKQTALLVENISKTFIIPHEKNDTLRKSFVNFFKSKKYEKFKALKKVNLKVNKGEFFGIIGQNGSGKSTLLKIIAGIIEPDQGKVVVNGEISPFLELGVGFNPELSGRDNVYLNATILGLNPKQIEQKYKKIVEFSGLERFIDQKLKRYSSGMRVRLAFSVAIHADKDILLMDEVLAVGDGNFQKKCLGQLERLKEQNKTIIFVSHALPVLRQHCKRAAYLDNGILKKTGQIEEVIRAYERDSKIRQEKEFLNKTKAVKKKIKTDNKKKFRIENVKFLNEKSKITNKFKTFERMTLRIYYDFDKKLTNVVLGIVINKDNKLVYATNNLRRGVHIEELKGKGYIDFVFDSIKLLEGNYDVSVTLSCGDRKKILDQKIQLFPFMIDNDRLIDVGVCNLEPKISFKK